MTLKVTRCICHDCSFEKIKEYAEEHKLATVEELQKREICSCGCRMCAPYIELILETGETAFEPGAYYRRSKGTES